jgi:hypothetical protein
MPWLGLLLWALACVGLCVSLLMDAGELDREPRLAARDQVVQGLIGRHSFQVTDDGSGRPVTRLSLPR